MLSMLLVGFYGIVDGFFIGQSLGDNGLAAVNLAWPLLVAITAIGTGIGTGGAIVMSLRSGAGETEKAKKSRGKHLYTFMYDIRFVNADFYSHCR